MGRRLVEPGGETGETGARLLHLGGRFRRHQLGALRAEQIGEIEQEELDVLVLGIFRKIAHSRRLPKVSFIELYPLSPCGRG